MESLLLLGGLGAALTAWFALGRGPGPAFAVAGDEDIKIASPGSYSPAPTVEDSAQEAAELYLRQKRAGNIDRARSLGEAFARDLVEWAGQTEQTAAPEGERARVHHQALLYSYGINRVIAERSPDSILAQTTLNVFYDAVEQLDPRLSADIKDMAAFSLYILVDRSRHRSEDEIGRIYAQLCGADDDRSLIEEGNRVYRESCQAGARQIDAAGYDQVE